MATTATTSSTSSIAVTLGVGSGIDFGALTAQLVEAQFSTKAAALTRKADTLTAQISAAGTLRSSIATFSSTLATLTKSGALQTQPTSGDPSVFAVEGKTGARLAGLSASLTVNSLATAQAAITTTKDWTRTTVIGTGDLTLTFGTPVTTDGTVTDFAPDQSRQPATIPVTDGTLQGIANAINTARKGVTASIVTDADGAHLVVKGATGALNGFSLTGPDGSALSQVNIVPGTSGKVNTVATDAQMVLDGLTVASASNSVTGLIDGVTINLQAAKKDVPVQIGTRRPGADLTTAVNNFVETYNSMHAVIKEASDAKTGTLTSDTAVRTLARSLSAITLTPLRTGVAGEPTTLADLGVRTNKDGTLEVDATRLLTAMTDYPDAVEEMFADGTGASRHGLNGALAAISSSASSTIYGLGASVNRYAELQSKNSAAQEKLTSEQADAKARMTKQFAATDARVAALKASQEYLKQQIAAWNASDN